VLGDQILPLPSAMECHVTKPWHAECSTICYFTNRSKTRIGPPVHSAWLSSSMYTHSRQRRRQASRPTWRDDASRAQSRLHCASPPLGDLAFKLIACAASALAYFSSTAVVGRGKYPLYLDERTRAHAAGDHTILAFGETSALGTDLIVAK
jgi:hypothetical protein